MYNLMRLVYYALVPGAFHALSVNWQIIRAGKICAVTA